jgi:hypothetical protein
MVKGGWDGRLGPSDGMHDLTKSTAFEMKTGSGIQVDSYQPQSGISFGPEWMERGHWVRIADLPATYQGEAEIHFVHPLLVRFTIHYSYVTGRGGPYFSQEFILTPDLLVTRLKSAQNLPFGLTVPLLENDGRELNTEITKNIAHTGFSKSGDRQYFIGLNENIRTDTSAASIQSTYGWLKPVRFETKDPSLDLMVYPKSPPGMSAMKISKGFKWHSDGFSTPLASVTGNQYRGKNAAGGEGVEMDLDGDGKSDVFFDKKCLFMFQLKDNTIFRVESDRKVSMKYLGKKYQLSANVPLTIGL